MRGPRLSPVHSPKIIYAALPTRREIGISVCGGPALAPSRPVWNRWGHVQARMGHATIQMTLDTYGHLFPSGDSGAELAAAQNALLR